MVAEGVLHAAEALLDLVCEGDVEDHCTQEPGKNDSLLIGDLRKTIKHILIMQGFSSEEPKKQQLANDEEPVLSGVVGSIGGIVIVELIQSLLSEVVLCPLVFLTFFASRRRFFRDFSSR